MEIYDAITGRRSVRRYKRKPIKTDDLWMILNAARWAPSAGNLQPWVFVVVTDPERKRKLAEAAGFQMWIAGAPVVIVAGANVWATKRVYGERGEKLYCIQDVAAAIQNMLLTAYSLGLSTCWVGAFHDEAVAKIVRFPDHVKPMAIIPLGYGAEKPRPPHRKKLDEIAFHNVYGEPLKLEPKREIPPEV